MRCKRCGEPWDLDSLHDEIKYLYGDEIDALREKYKNDPRRYRIDDPFQKQYEAKYFNPMMERFRKEGCTLFGCKCEVDDNTERRSLLTMIDDLCGDDVDFAESMVEDAEMMGLL